MKQAQGTKKTSYLLKDKHPMKILTCMGEGEATSFRFQIEDPETGVTLTKAELKRAIHALEVHEPSMFVKDKELDKFERDYIQQSHNGSVEREKEM